MRLLFIYFYKEQATFKEGTVIRFSKKYTEDIKVQNQNHQFDITLTTNANYQDDFYSKSTDIGIIIGENGTGKSILVNSIRDKDNKYSIAIFEDASNKFFIGEKDIKVQINNNPIKNKRNFEYIYYSPIIDTFDNDINNEYNISNRALIKKYDDHNLDLILKEIENDDLKKYFKYNKNKNVSVSSLKLNALSVFFDQFYNDMEKNINDLFEIIFSKADKNVYLRIVDTLSLNSLMEITNNIDFYKVEEVFNRDNNLYEKYYRSLQNLINKKIFNPNLLEYKVLIKESFISINKEKLNVMIDHIQIDRFLEDFYHKDLIYFHFEELFEDLAHKFIDFNDRHFLHYLENVKPNDFEKVFYDFEKNQEFERFVNVIYLIELFDYIIDYIDKKITIDNIRFMARNRTEFNRIKKDFKKFLRIKLLPFIIKKIHYSLNIDRLIFYDFTREDYKKIVKTLVNMDFIKDTSLFNKIKEKEKVVNASIDNYILDIIKDKSIDLELKKIIFVYSFHNLYNSKNEYFNLILILNLAKVFILVDDEKSLLDFLNKYAEKNLENLENYFKEDDFDNFIIKKIDEENIINLDENSDVFFEYNKKLLKYEFDFFESELNPTLSSGQKTILFIFARINDAIENIGKNKNILIMLDEADLTLHLEWQRKFINDLIEFLNNYSNNKFYILYATHSPMILSDITDDRVVFLKKDKETGFSNDKQKLLDNDTFLIESTFGANIYDIYNDSFFMKSFMGEFAEKKINQVIDIVNLYKIIKELKDGENGIDIKESYINSFKDFFNETIDEKYILENRKKMLNEKQGKLKLTIQSIGEPMLRNKLLNDIKYLFDEDKNIDKIVKELRDKENSEIMKTLKSFSQSEQNEILKKLYLENTDD